MFGCEINVLVKGMYLEIQVMFPWKEKWTFKTNMRLHNNAKIYERRNYFQIKMKIVLSEVYKENVTIATEFSFRIHKFS